MKILTIDYVSLLKIEIQKCTHSRQTYDAPHAQHTQQNRDHCFSLGERGIGLSEGQAQRIAIARGLLRPGAILLLDEISSSLDEQTEHELFSRLFDYCKDKTMIFITHRPAVSQLCDDVIRLG